MHEDFLSYIMIGLSRGFVGPRSQPQERGPLGRRWDGGEFFPPEPQREAGWGAENRPAAKDRPVKARRVSRDGQLSHLLHPSRPGWPSICR
jgi:hypothetical protein